MAKILVGCETSGEVRRAFQAKGHEVWSCDLLPADDGETKFHRQGDALEFARSQSWDIGIFHPSCTYLCNSGVRWLYSVDDGRNEARYHKMMKAAHFFMDLYNLPIPRICIENPIMRGHAKRGVGIPQQTQVVQPWHFGDEAFKATCLWLKGLDPLDTHTFLRLTPPAPGTPEHKRWSVIHQASPRPDRWKVRSKTFPGIASAMARTWG